MSDRACLTDHAHEALSLAHELAEGLNHDGVTAMHLALGICRHGSGAAAAVLHNLGVTLDDVVRELEAELPGLEKGHRANPAVPHSIPLEIIDAAGNAVRSTTPPAHEHSRHRSDGKFIDQARLEAAELIMPFCGTEHLLLAILRDDRSLPAQLLARHGVRFEDVRSEIERVYRLQS